MERNFKLVVEYDGTDFVGWQTQENGVSIQSCIEQVLEKMTGSVPYLRAAGRTDAGVHAYAQVITLRMASRLSVERIAGGLNALLPKAISVHSVTEMPEPFDAKRDSRWKRYRYTIYQGRYRSAHLERTALHVTQPLNLEAMRAAAAHLVGHHDFEAFRAAQCQAEHARRNMFAIAVETEPRPPAGSLVHITYHGNAFVRHMCRILTGTLLEVGRGERSPDSIPALILSRDRKQAGMTAPAKGLCLLEVGYD